MKYPNNFEVIVVGGGHAGVEASLAAARMGAKTLLLTHNIETIGQMSCNPAIGGIGKGHLVKEIDALDGIMGKAADFAGIQWRILNQRKGPAVRATRAQADRLLYKHYIRSAVENQPNLTIFQSAVSDFIIKNCTILGVKTIADIDFYGQTVILTAGTFLLGKIHIGLNNFTGGRSGDPASVELAEKLRDLPFETARMKTGTPPRIDKKTVDFSQMTEQKGDEPLPYFSFLGRETTPKQTSCYITHTNEKTHEIIRKYLHQSPMYAGVIIDAFGPRYCPSIEDKVTRFADKSSHQIFIEPESLSTNELYPNGVSTSLPFEAQLLYIRSIKGLENAVITRAGYAIEYDFFNPKDLHRTLETKAIANLFFAGQINGTTGYEEAAAQGLLAGINAVLKVRNQPHLIIEREQGYLGVMIDDLVSQGTKEPYRMFTSRAEYRLLLREDNADSRLTELGYKLGCVSQNRFDFYRKKQDALNKEQNRLTKILIRPNQLPNLAQATYANELLKRPEIDYQFLSNLPDFPVCEIDQQVIDQIDILAKYSGYIDRQKLEVAKITKNRQQKLPKNFDYQNVHGLSAEVVEKLNRHQPANLDHASRISGITPAALSLLLIYLKKNPIN